MLNKARQLYEFGPFRIDPDRRQLLRENRPVPLQSKALDILLVLVENSEKVVSKDALMKAVWPDTFVEESNLAQHIFVLRKTLGDAVEEKRYIVTVPGRGYRFAGAVRIVSEDRLAPAAEEEDTLVVEQHTRSQMVIQPSALPGEAVRQLAGRRRIRPAVLVLSLAIVAILAVAFRPYVAAPKVLRIRQLTNLRTVSYNGMPVTDGPRIYFDVWEGKNRVFRYVSPEGGEVFPLEIALPNIDIQDISPSGSELLIRNLATRSYRHDECDIWRAPVSGGSPRALGGLRAGCARFSADGSTIVRTAGTDLYLANGDGTNSRKLVSLPGDPYYPAWSPDGRRIRFSLDDPRGRGTALWEADVAAKKAYPLLPDWPAEARVQVGRWSPDGRYFFFTARSEGTTKDIWAMREPQGTLRRVDPRPVHLTAGPLHFFNITPSKDGKSLFAIGAQWRGQLVRYDRATSQYRLYASGISADQVAFSRDGQWMAYIEFPENNLVRARVDGSERRQLTFPPMRAYDPQWSPDGTQVAFHGSAHLGSPRRIYLVPGNGGTAVPATAERHDRQLYPSWSSSGDSILFSGSDESGDNAALYRVDMNTKQVSLLPGTSGLFWAQLSPDGHYVVALTVGAQQVTLYDTQSHQTRTLAPYGNYPAWSGDGRYAYYLAGEAGIYRWQVSTGKIEKVLEFPEFGLAGIWATSFGLTPDGDPLVLRDMSSVDLYALDLDLP